LQKLIVSHLLMLYYLLDSYVLKFLKDVMLRHDQNLVVLTSSELALPPLYHRRTSDEITLDEIERIGI
jgi:hypothetical protein